MKNKRTFALIGLVVLLAVAVVMDYQFGKNTNNNTLSTKSIINQTNTKSATGDINKNVASVNANVFADYRSVRNKTRSENIANLKEIVDNSKTSQATRDKAQQDIIKLTEETNKEMVIENLIKAKGFNDALVFIDDSSANVLIDTTKTLAASNVAQIQDIVTRETGMAINQVHITKRK